MISIRCSALPRIAQCPASANPPAVKIDPPSEAGVMGTATHEFCAGMVANKPLDVAALAVKHDVDPDELAKLCGLSRGAWRTLAEHFPHPTPEHSMTFIDADAGVTLTGTADVASVNGVEVAILDWKSGWADREHSDQVRGYAWLVMQERPEIDTARTHVLNLRRGVVDHHVYTRAELAAWWEALILDLKLTPDTYRPSPDACGFCPRSHECPARTVMLRHALQVIEKVGGGVDEPMVFGGVEMSQALEFAKAAESFAELVRSIVRTQVIASGGTMPIDDDYEFFMDLGQKREINFAAGEDVLVAYAGEKWREAVTIGNGKIEKIVGEYAPKGQKGKMVKAMWAALDSADAIEVKPTSTLRVRKREKAIEVHTGVVDEATH